MDDGEEHVDSPIVPTEPAAEVENHVASFLMQYPCENAEAVTSVESLLRSIYKYGLQVNCCLRN